MKIAFLNYSPFTKRKDSKNSKTNNKENVKEVFDTCDLKIKNICVVNYSTEKVKSLETELKK